MTDEEAVEPDEDPPAATNAGRVDPEPDGEADEPPGSPRPRRSRWRRVLIGVGVLVLLSVAAIAWLAYTGFKARTELEAVRAEVHALRADIAAGDLTAARTDALTIRAHADKAHDLTTGPIWAGAAAVPFVGSPLDTTRAVTSGVQAVAGGALPALVHAADTLHARSLRAPDGSIDVAAISAIAPELDSATGVLRHATTTIGDSSANTWSGTVNSARADLLSQLTDLTRSVSAAGTAAQVAPTLLGAHGPRTYMITFENDAELRGTGGLPGAFAIMRADHGRISFVRFESDTELSTAKAAVHFGKDFDTLWRGDPARSYVNSNQSPHFPYAAQIWTGMWRSVSGQRLDGAIALDPTTLSYLLAVTGPATMPDGSPVSAGNVVRLTQKDVYSRYARRNDQRKAYLLQVARAVSGRLVTGSVDVTSLLKAAGQAASESRLLIWVRDPAIEHKLEPYPLSGAVPADSVPYAGLTINNGGADKLNYYLHGSFSYRRTGCGASRVVTATLTLRNDAPRHGLPGYVTDTNPGATPGIQLVNVSYYASAGAQVNSVTHDGAEISFNSGTERGHPVTLFAVNLPFRTPQTFVFTLTEPAGTTAPLVRVQPMVNPMQVTVSDAACGP